jgi:hypothetical protein
MMKFQEMVDLMHRWEKLRGISITCRTQADQDEATSIIDQLEAIKEAVPYVTNWLYSTPDVTIDDIIAKTDRTTLEEIKYDMEHPEGDE